MAEELALARAIIQVEGDATQLVAAMASGEKAVADFSSASKQNIATAVAALAGLGEAAAQDFLKLSSASQRAAKSLAIETGKIQVELGRLSQTEFKQLENILRGASATISTTFVGALDDAKRALQEVAEANAFDKKFQDAQQLVRASEYVRFWTDSLEELERKEAALKETQLFERKFQDAQQLVRAAEYVDFWTSSLNRLEEEERQIQDNLLFERKFQDAQQLVRASEYVRFWEDALQQLEATERRVAADTAFIEGLNKRAAAIGKTQADLLELEAAQRGLSTQAAPAIAALRAQEEKQRQLTGALVGYDAAARSARVSANQLRTAYAQLPAQITDVVTSLASGIPAYLVLIQQGGQIKDSFGGIGNAARALVGLLTPTNVALAALAVTVGAVAYGFIQGSKELDNFNKALILSGRQAGVTSSELAAIASNIGNISPAGTQKAAEALALLASSGAVAKENLELVALAAVNLENVGGPAIDDTVKTFQKLVDSPLKASVELNKSTNFLTQNIFEQIRALEEQGKKTEAAAVAQRAFAEESNKRTQEIRQNLSLTAGVWDQVTAAIVRAKNAILNIGRTSLDDLIKQQEQLVATYRQALVGGAAGSTQRIAAEALTQAQVRLNTLRQQSDAEQQAAQAGQSNADATAARAKLNDLINQNLTKEETLQRNVAAILALQNELEQKGNITSEERLRIQRLINNEVEAFLKGDKEPRSKKVKEEVDLVQKSYEDLARTLNDELIAATVELQAAQQGLTAEQTAYLKIVKSQAWKEYSDGQRISITTFYEQIIAAKELTKAELDRKKAIEESNKAIAKAAEDEAKRASELALENQALENEIAAIGKTKEELAQLEAQRILTNAAALEGLAIVKEITGANQDEVASIRLQVAELQKRAGLVLKKAGAEAAEETRKANEKAAEDAYNTWKETIDDISRSLADGIIDGGRSAARALQNLFNNLVLRPIIQAALQPLVQGVAAAFGFLGPGGAAAAGGGQSGIQTAINLASTANTLNTSLSAFSAGLGASLGKAAVAAGNAFGSTALTQFGTGLQGSQLAAGLQGPTTVGAGGATGLGAATAPYITAAAGIAAGVLAGRGISGGYSALGGRSGNAAVNTGTAVGAIVGSIVPVIGTAVGAAVGGAIGGLVNRAFGRKAPELAGRELVGTFQQGDFAGNIISTIVEKGGWFRKDKISQELEPVVGDFGKALNEAGAKVIDIVRQYGRALSLPVDELVNIPSEIRVKLTGNIEEDRKALETALTKYSESLLQSYAKALEPLRLADESIVQTIERVGNAIFTVNDVLANIGQSAIDFTVEGGKAAIALTNLFGGAQGFAQATSEYYQRFFDESEKVQNATNQLGQVFTDLNLSVPTTKEQFKDLVGAQDLTTQSGRETFAVLMSIAGIFDDVTTAAEKAAQALNDAVEALRERFRTPEQSAAAGTRRIAAELVDLGVLQGTVQEVTNILTQATRDDVLKFVETFVTLGDVSSETKTTVANLAGTLVDLKDKATEAADTFNRELRNAINANIGAFQTPEQQRLQPFVQIQQDLADVGIEIDLKDILNASKEDILTYAKAIVESGDVSNDAKLAVVEAAGALGTLRNEADQLKLDDILAEIGDVDVLKGKTKSLSEQYLDTVSSIDELERGLAELTGTVDQSIQEILSSLLQTQKALTSFRENLSGQIEEARLRTLSPEARIQALREEEARLFAELRVSSDPVATAQKLQGVVLQRIREEANLRAKNQQELLTNAETQLQLTKEARDAQIDAIEAQIDALERLKNLAEDIAQFTGSLRFSDISPLNYEDQLNAARQLFETTLSAAERGDPNAQGNLVGNARAFLDEARAYYASSGAYSAIFSEVTGALDALGLTATQADPQIAALESQIETLKNFTEVVIDTSAEEVAGLTAVRDALDVRITENTEAIRLQTELARQEIENRIADRDRIALDIQQRIDAANRLQEKIDNIDLNLGKLLGNAELVGAAPT